MGTKSMLGLGRVPLADELLATGPLRAKSKKRKAKREDEPEGYVDSKPSRKILKIGQELEEEDREQQRQEGPSPAFAFESRFPSQVESDEEAFDNDDDWADEEEEVEDEEVRSLKSSRKYAFD